MVYRRSPEEGVGAFSYPCCSTEDMAMRTTLDFPPCSGRASASTASSTCSRTRAVPHPWTTPYDITRSGDDDNRIIMAVAGVSQDEQANAHTPHKPATPEEPQQEL